MQQGTFKYYLHRIFTLALPVAAGQVGHIITGMADNAMVGHVGTIPLAAAAFVNGLFFIPFIFGLGLIASMTPLVGKAYAINDKAKTLSYLRHGLVFAFLVGIILSGLSQLVAQFMDRMGQDPEVVAEAKVYFTILNYSLTPALMFTILKNYLEGMGKTLPPMLVSLSMNLLNIVLNYILIYGKLGFEPMGLQGAGIATLIARIGMLVIMLLYGMYHPSTKAYFTNITQIKLRWVNFSDLVRLGLPMGLQFLMEVGIFGAGSIMMGWISANAQAAHIIALQLCALTFLISSGIGTGGTIVVSNLNGKQAYKELRLAGHTAMVMALIVMSLGAIVFALFNKLLPMIFVNDPEVISIAASLLLIAALFQLFDGFQAVAISILRGMEDVRLPTIATFIAYWLIGMPTCYMLAFPLGMGYVGIWYGFLIGLGASSVMLYLRFRYRSAELIRSNE